MQLLTKGAAQFFKIYQHDLLLPSLYQQTPLQSYLCVMISLCNPCIIFHSRTKQGIKEGVESVKMTQLNTFHFPNTYTKHNENQYCHHALLHHSNWFYELPHLMLQENGFHCSRTGLIGTPLNIYSHGLKMTIRKYKTTFLHPVTECDSFCSHFNEMQTRLSAQKS